MTGVRMRAHQQIARARREEPICKTCADHGFVRVKGTSEVVPCPGCNPDGQDEDESGY